MKHLWLVLVALLIGAVSPAVAHNLPYSLVKAHFEADGSYDIEIECHIAALIVGLPQLHLTEEQQEAFAALPDDDVAKRVAVTADYLRQTVALTVDGRRVAIPTPAFPSIAQIREDSRMTAATASPSAPIRITGQISPTAHQVALSFPLVMGSVLIQFSDPQRNSSTQALVPDQVSAPLVLRAGGNEAPPHANPLVTIGQYLRLGFTHIVPGGLDHILFVLSLFLLIPRWRPLAIQVTAFTVSHSITLALATFNIVSLPPQLTETLIAISIVIVAVDNLVERELTSWRPFVVFGFGFLHGLGFASVLKDLGLPNGQKVLALASFNVGVEFGQLFVLVLAFVALGWTIRRPWYRRRVVIPFSIAIAAVASVWAVQRAFL